MGGILVGSAKVAIAPDMSGFMAGLDAKLKSELSALDATVPLKAEIDKASLARVKAAMGPLAGSTVPLKFSIDPASVAKARAALGPLAAGQSVPLRFDVDPSSVAAAKAALGPLAGTAIPVRYDVNTASLATAALAQRTLTADTTASARAANQATQQFWGLWGVLNRRISLFGGGLNQQALGALRAGFGSVSGWHLLIDSIAEFLAVVIPASVAVGAFGIAASDAVNNVIRQMTNMHTVMDATGQSMKPMTDDLEKMHQAVQPQVYQIAGDALAIMNSKSGEFNTLAKGTGTVLDQLAARITVAVTSGHGFSSFLSQAIPDVAKVGDVVGNLGGVFGNVFKALPGYANFLLTVVDGFSRLLEAVSAVAVPILNVGLALHGLILWGGLAVTAVLQLITPARNLVTWAGGVATSMRDWAAAGSQAAAVNDAVTKASTGADLALTRQALAQAALAKAAEGSAAGEVSFAVASDGTAVAVDAASTSVWGLDAALAALGAVNPLVWIGAAVAALGGLVWWMRSAKSTTQEWSADMQTAIGNTQIQSGLGMITNDLEAVNAQLWKAQSSLNAIPKTTMVGTRFGQTVGPNPAYQQQLAQVQALTGAQQQLVDEGQLWNYRVDQLGKSYGGNTAAMGLLVAAGVTTKQMLTDNAETWAEIKTQVAGVSQGYQAMGQTGGTLGNDLQVLNAQATDQYAAMQKLNQGWQVFTSNMTGTQSTFDTFGQQITTLNADWKAGKVSIDALSGAGLTLNSAFESQIGNANALISTWRTAGIANNMFVSGVKDTIAPLTKYAAGSQEATAQLVGLAQEAGYDGPVSMRRLVQWLGNTKGALADVKSITDQATIQEALLTTSMNDQGNVIASRLIGDINNSIIAYDGVSKAAENYGKAIAEYGQQSSQAHSARQQLTDDLIASGKAAGDSNSKIAAMIATVLKIPQKRALELVLTGEGHYSISQQTAASLGGTGGGDIRQPSALFGHAAGGYVRAGTTSTADDVLVRVSKGELIVPTNMVNAGYVDHLRGRIPGFAAGGLIDTGNQSVLSGQYAVNLDNQFTQTVASSLAAAMTSAISQASAAVPGSSAPVGALQKYAMQLLAAHGWASQWPQFNAVVNRESGWRWNAQNPTSGAYGIPQALPGSKMAAAGSDWLTDPYTQLRWMIDDYIGPVYGDPAGAWQSEVSRGWYDQGINGPWLPQGLSLALNTTGGPEAIVRPDQLATLATGGAAGDTYIAQFPDAWSQAALQSQVMAGFNAMSMNATRQGRIGRQQ